MNTPLDTVLARFPDAKERRGQWIARCPAHDDQQASLGIGPGDNGGCVVKCYAGCDTSAVLAAVGLTLADLMPPKDTTKATKPVIVARYPYTDADGVMLYEVCRYEPKTFRQRRPDGKGGYLWNLTGVQRVLYRLPDVLQAVADGVTVYVVEGEKDADNLFKAGLIATTNAGGADKWHDGFTETLRGASVVIVPDNDEPGRKHARTVAMELHGKASKVKVLALPGLPPKGDVSDWLRSGGTASELQALADAAPVWVDTLPTVSAKSAQTAPAAPVAPAASGTDAPQYEIEPGGIFWNRRTQDGVSRVQLANFAARIVQDTIEDDGAETKRRFTIEAALPGQSPSLFDVSASEFGGMEWAIDRLGSRALLAPGRGTKDHARAAIQTLSDAKERRVHTHTGWVKSGDAWHYCHGGDSGTIGASAIEEDGAATLPGCDTVHDGQEIAVTLSGSLSRFALPTAPTGDQLKASIHAVLRFWQLGTADVVLPVAVAPFRAVLGACDFSLFVAGPTGVFKSQIAALSQQHFGKEMNSRNLPADWSSTDNYLEGLAFVAKDALLVIDEFVPRGAVTERERAHAKADRVLRAQGNGSAKGRMRADGSLRPAKPPRGLILATGEEVPSGQSLRARLLVMEVAPGNIPAPELTSCQKDAGSGLYAECMAGFIAWLATRYGQIHDGLACEVEVLRGKLPSTALPHARTAEIVCHLSAGARHFLWFCLESGAITREEAEKLFTHVWKTLCAACSRQGSLQKENEPAERFVELLAAALSGGRCHVASLQGCEPFEEGPEKWGWRSCTIGAGEHERHEWRAQGECIGYVDGENMYLLPDAAYTVTSKLTHESGDSVAVRPKTLSKRLHEKKMLASVAPDGLTIQVPVQGRRVRVWHVLTALIQGDF